MPSAFDLCFPHPAGSVCHDDSVYVTEEVEHLIIIFTAHNAGENDAHIRINALINQIQRGIFAD
ncbi:hypothetical protein H6F51_10515 [Cyanobacteria bacterium FACHB-DQ100]|nr:hypothetical protein [Cyanobacteria bacterium FACHB-DQ100]